MKRNSLMMLAMLGGLMPSVLLEESKRTPKFRKSLEDDMRCIEAAEKKRESKNQRRLRYHGGKK